MDALNGSRPDEVRGSTSTLAVRGATWTALGIFLQRLVQTGALLVLARLLAPEDFGLVAIATLFLSFANRAKSLGLQTALLQHRERPIEAANTVFLVNGAITAAVFLLVLAVAPFASGWFGGDRAGAVLAVMALRLFPQAAASVPATLAVRSLNFRAQALITFAEGLVTAALAVALAAAGLGVWALVFGSLAGAVVSAVLWWVRPAWRPWLGIDREVARGLLHAGVRIWSAGNLAYLVDSANRLFIARFLGVVPLGHYEVGTRLVHVPLGSLLGIHDGVALPAFCREQRNLERLGRWFLRLTTLMLLLSGAAAGVLFFYAEVLVPVLFGDQWHPVVPAVRALAPLALLLPLLSLAPVYVATGREGLLLRFTALRAAVTVAGLLAAAQVSLVAVCAVESAAALLFAPVNLVLVKRLVALPGRSLLRALAPPAAGLSGFAVTATLTAERGAELVGTGLLGALLLPLPALAVFAAAVLVTRPHIVAEGREVLAVALGGKTFPDPGSGTSPVDDGAAG